jgi:hypothetical protein
MSKVLFAGVVSAGFLVGCGTNTTLYNPESGHVPKSSSEVMVTRDLSKVCTDNVELGLLTNETNKYGVDTLIQNYKELTAQNGGNVLFIKVEPTGVFSDMRVIGDMRLC